MTPEDRALLQKCRTALSKRGLAEDWKDQTEADLVSAITARFVAAAKTPKPDCVPVRWVWGGFWDKPGWFDRPEVYAFIGKNYLGKIRRDSTSPDKVFEVSDSDGLFCGCYEEFSDAKEALLKALRETPAE